LLHSQVHEGLQYIKSYFRQHKHFAHVTIFLLKVVFLSRTYCTIDPLQIL